MNDMNINNVLGLKMISWDSVKGEFISPARPDFTWDDQGIKSAKCTKDPRHKPPEANCTCGIYATYKLEIAEDYQRRILNVLMLVEAGGKTAIYTEGWRSEQLRFLAVIDFNPNDRQLHLAANQAADYYGLQILPLDASLIIMDIFNTHLLPYYESKCIPRKTALALWRNYNEIKV